MLFKSSEKLPLPAFRASLSTLPWAFSRCSLTARSRNISAPTRLAVYATVINISTFVQCCAYSVGQAAQPILSTNYGAGNAARIRKTLYLALGTSMAFAAFWTGLSELAPGLYIRIFMRPTDAILAIAPSIIRRYGVSFILLPVNIFSTYYFQSILRPKDSFIVSIARGLVVSGLLIFALPAVSCPKASGGRCLLPSL